MGKRTKLAEQISDLLRDFALELTTIRVLDAAVFAAYGWPSDLSDDEILARLLALNLKRAAT
ncbi:MAG: hypothetical protein HY870_05475 [Chloroflexi bacterium]|nr:hypothetical protein [Chloroflexota bacterium]